MNEAVALTSSGSRVIGKYDSYGNLGGMELVDYEGEVAVYHKACWELKGRPEFTEPSRHSDDQGFCHAMHGTPLPLPTHNWLEQCPKWHIIDMAIRGMERAYHDAKYDKWERAFEALPDVTRARLVAAFQVDRDARAKVHKAARAAWARSDEDTPEPRIDEFGGSLLFDGVEWYTGPVWVHIQREARKNRQAER